MSELIEIVFENINKSKLIDAINYLISDDCNLISFESFLATDSESIIKDLSIDKAIRLDEFGCMIIKLNELKLKDEIQLKNINLWVRKYEEIFDLEINFDIEENANIIPELSSILFDFSNVFAKIFSIDNYYAGLDPAIDEDTRIFTTNTLGPLYLKIFNVDGQQKIKLAKEKS